MNTVGGSDPSGGSNNAVTISHTHNIVATNGGAGGQETNKVQNGLNTGTNSNSAISSAGVSGTNLNKPLYKGVAVWERTA